jgi:hypothetical protein
MGRWALMRAETPNRLCRPPVMHSNWTTPRKPDHLSLHSTLGASTEFLEQALENWKKRAVSVVSLTVTRDDRGRQRRAIDDRSNTKNSL